MFKKILLGLIFVSLLVAVFLSCKEPRLDREWSPDQAVLATSQVDGDTVTITNIRNFTYRSVTDYTPGYYDGTFTLSELTHVDYIVEPFGDIGAAHTFLSFGFRDGRQVAISAEIRKEVGETFSPLRGVLREYELVYVIADERDVIGLRANHRNHDVYVYPTTATAEQAQSLFARMIDRANKLQMKPEFYHTVLSNCTTNIAAHINEFLPGTIGFDYRLLLPEYSDSLAQEIGFIAPDISIEEARKRYRVNEAAAIGAAREDFSTFIRTYVAPVVQSEAATVTRVIDGDTIEVVTDTGLTKRVRYIGIDTPEMHYSTESPACMADAARRLNQELVASTSVILVRDVSEYDGYGRWLRYVLVDGLDVGATLLERGYAEAVMIAPDVARAPEYRAIEASARQARRGMWSAECQANVLR
jgi:endonuclease YncB( thermonuclease family)